MNIPPTPLFKAGDWVVHRELPQLGAGEIQGPDHFRMVENEAAYVIYFYNASSEKMRTYVESVLKLDPLHQIASL